MSSCGCLQSLLAIIDIAGSEDVTNGCFSVPYQVDRYRLHIEALG